MAKKDSEIALLKSEYSDEKKMLEIYAELNKQINGVKETVAANRDRADERLFGTYEKLNNKIDYNKSVQDGVNASQLAYNGTNSATIACMQGQIAQLQSMTKTVIPNSSVCPGWGVVNIVPAALSATAWTAFWYGNFSAVLPLSFSSQQNIIEKEVLNNIVKKPKVKRVQKRSKKS